MANCPRFLIKQMRRIVTCAARMLVDSRRLYLYPQEQQCLWGRLGHTALGDAWVSSGLETILYAVGPASYADATCHHLHGPFWDGEAIFTSVNEKPRVSGKHTRSVKEADEGTKLWRLLRTEIRGRCCAEAHTCSLKLPAREYSKAFVKATGTSW